MTILLLQGSRRTGGNIGHKTCNIRFHLASGLQLFTDCIRGDGGDASDVGGHLGIVWSQDYVGFSGELWCLVCLCVCARPLLGTVDICPCSGLTDLNLTAFLNPSYLYERFRTPR